MLPPMIPVFSLWVSAGVFLQQMPCLCTQVMGAQTFVLAGDPNQLPPTVKSQRAASQGLTHTLFDNILRGGVDQKLLDMQYRMHPLIANFPSTAFYGGRVRDGEPGVCSVCGVSPGSWWVWTQLSQCFVAASQGCAGSPCSFLV